MEKEGRKLTPLCPSASLPGLIKTSCRMVGERTLGSVPPVNRWGDLQFLGFEVHHLAVIHKGRHQQQKGTLFQFETLYGTSDTPSHKNEKQHLFPLVNPETSLTVSLRHMTILESKSTLTWFYLLPKMLVMRQSLLTHGTTSFDQR